MARFELNKLEKADSISNIIPTAGKIITFFEEQSDGGIKLRLKKEDGTLSDISGTGNGSISSGITAINVNDSPVSVLDGTAKIDITHTTVKDWEQATSGFKYDDTDLKRRVGDVESGLAGKAASSHTHSSSEITDLQSKLNGKIDVPGSEVSVGKVLTKTDGGTAWQSIPSSPSGVTQEYVDGELAKKQNKIDGSHKISASFVEGLHRVATTGNYSDLSGRPVNVDEFTNNVEYQSKSQVAATVSSAVAGLVKKSELPVVNDAKVTITQGGMEKGSFTLNQAGEKTIEIDAGGGQSVKSWTTVKPVNGLHLLIKYGDVGGDRVTASNTLIDTKNNAPDRAKVKAYNEFVDNGTWDICPAEGFGSPYDNYSVSVDLTGIPEQCMIYYCWLGEGGAEGDWKSQRFPSFSSSQPSGGSINPNSVIGYTPGIKIWLGTESEYNSIQEKDATTVYMIKEA